MSNVAMSHHVTMLPELPVMTGGLSDPQSHKIRHVKEMAVMCT